MSRRGTSFVTTGSGRQSVEPRDVEAAGRKERARSRRTPCVSGSRPYSCAPFTLSAVELSRAERPRRSTRKLFERPELDRLRRAGLRARGPRWPPFQPVVAERALPDSPVLFLPEPPRAGRLVARRSAFGWRCAALFEHAETGMPARSSPPAVADVLLDDDRFRTPCGRARPGRNKRRGTAWRAWQCLHTSDSISQRRPVPPSPFTCSGFSCSTNANMAPARVRAEPQTCCRRTRRSTPVPSCGIRFHSLQRHLAGLAADARTDVSVKKPTRVCASSP